MNRRREQPDRADSPLLRHFPPTHHEPEYGDGVVVERSDPELESTARYRTTTPPDGRR